MIKSQGNGWKQAQEAMKRKAQIEEMMKQHQALHWQKLNTQYRPDSLRTIPPAKNGLSSMW
jgi:hypothetical protein